MPATSKRRTTSRSRAPGELAECERQMLGEAPAPHDRADLLERLAKLRDHVYEAEKLCQWISCAVNTPELPAGTWIYVDVTRMSVLAAMRAAQLLQLELQRQAPPPPAAEKE